MSDTTLAIVLALASAAVFSVTTSLQHRAAGRSSAEGVVALMLDLLRRPAWLIATLGAFVAQLLQAGALAFGSLALVGPLMISSVVLAVVVRAALDATWPQAREVLAAAAVAAGIALLLGASHIEPGEERHLGRAALATLAVVVLAVLARQRSAVATPHAGAVVLAIAGGILFGVSAGLLKVVSELVVEPGALPAGLWWPLVGQIVVGLTATSFNQRAYQLAPLPVSMPLLNVVTVVMTLLFGWWVFGEQPVGSWGAGLVMVAGLALIGWGLRAIAQLFGAPAQSAA